MASEKRLIDANKLSNKAIPLEGLDGNGIPYAVMAVSLDAIEDAPTVDAVEVVRCKDCKHYRWEQEPCNGRTQRFCNLHKGLVVVDRDTFCSYGERREGE